MALTSLSIISCAGQKTDTTVTVKPYISINGKDTVVNNLSILFIKRANAEHIKLGAVTVDLDSCEVNRQAAIVAQQKTDSNWRATEVQLINMRTERDNNLTNYTAERDKVDSLQKKNTRLAKVWKSLTGVFVGLVAASIGVGYYLGHR